MKVSHSYNGYKYTFDPKSPDQTKMFSITSEDTEVPNELYHYYDCNFFGVDAIVKSYIYANHPYHFNDPYDCARGLISYDNCTLEDVLELNDDFFDKNLIEKLYRSKEQKDRKELIKHLNYLLFNVIYLKVGIFCMSGRVDNNTLWSYYSNHKGFAVKFNIQKIQQSFWGPFPVNYTDDFEPIDYLKFKRASFIFQSNIKSINWKPENEFRLLFFGPDTMRIPYFDTPNSHDRKFKIDINAVSEIVLGFNFFDINEYDTTRSTPDKGFVAIKSNKKNKRKLFRYLMENNIPVSMIRQKEDDFDYKPIPLRIKNETRSKYILDFQAE